MAVATGEQSDPTPRPAASARSGLPVHPVFFAAFPVLSVYSANLAIVPLEDLWRPMLISVSAAIAATLVFWPIFRNLQKGAMAATALIVSSFLYSSITAKVSYLAALSVWVPFALIICFLVSRAFRTTVFLNILSVAMVLVAAANIVYGQAKITIDQMRIKQAPGAANLASKSSRPDIFYFILDGYGRADMLKRVMGFDDSAFINGLKDRGFYVADRSHSNYVQTEISLSSSLNLRFIPDLVPHVDPKTTDRTPFDTLISNNLLSRFLRDQGYRTIDITSGFPPVRFPYADLWLKHGSDISLFETALLQMTPLVPDNGGVTSQFTWRYKTLHQAFDNVRELAAPTPRPRFVFIHILAPHPPFVLAADGSFVRPKGPFGYWDGSDYMQYCGNRESYMKGYMAQAIAINHEALRTADTLIASSTNKPIIIFQGDHGSKSKLDQLYLEKTDVTECFENLEAFYVPKAVKDSLYPSITPVNEFRLILSKLFGADLPLLPDRSWYSPFPYPFEFTDVTDRVTRTKSEGALAQRKSPARPAKDTVALSRVAG